MLLQKEYPYMYARVSAKRAKLLEESDYQNLIKMEPNGIARKLEEGEYKQEINELGSRHEGIELIELALNQNLSRTLRNLFKISPDSIDGILEAYLRRYDILSYKRLLRWKQNGQKQGIEDLLTPATDIDKEKFMEISEESFEEIKRSIKFPRSEIDYQAYIKDEEDLTMIEHKLDQAYFDEITYVASETDNKYFIRFVREEINFENVKIALRLKKHDIDSDKIKRRLLKGSNDDVAERIAESRTMSDAQEIVEKELLPDEDLSESTVEDIEHLLEVKRLERALKMLHQSPMGLTSIIGYIIAKKTEVKNLRMLLRAKETGIQNQDTIERNLIIQ